MNRFFFLTIIIFIATACTRPPTLPNPAVPDQESDRECEITPHDIPFQGIPIPVALVVNRAEAGWLDLLWRDGTLMGSWETNSVIPVSNLHIAGPATNDVENLDLIYQAGDESGNSSFILKHGDQSRTLVEFSSPVLITGFVGIPARPVFTYSTLILSNDSGTIKSSIMLAGIENEYEEKVVYQEDRSDSRYIVPISIHRDESDQPDGIWYTTRLWGIGGDWQTDQRAGLFYIDLKTNANLEFLGIGCPFASLSTSQARAAWIEEKAIHIVDLHTGQDAFYPSKDNMKRGPVIASLSPEDSAIAWLESTGWQEDENFDMILRFGTLSGNIIREYSGAFIAESANLGEGSSILPVGWIFPENESLLVQVFTPSHDPVLLAIDINTGVVSKITDADLVGFGYP